MSFFSKYHLQIKSKTWNKDSYGLYDYETRNHHTQSLLITRPSRIFRSQNEISHHNTPLTFDSLARKNTGVVLELDSPKSLASISDGPNGIQINPDLRGDEISSESFWHVLDRDDSTNGYILKANDVIKLGRVLFKINQIKLPQESQVQTTNPYELSLADSIRNHMQKAGLSEELIKASEKVSDVPKASAGAMCKICLSENQEEEEDDPLLSPCNCTGSVKYVHLKCIQNWVQSKLNTQQQKNIVTIFWKSLSCELCKQKLSLKYYHNNKEFSLISFGDKIGESYVILESFSRENDSTGIHIIDLSANQDFKLGRSHECDLKLTDISVSRVHAIFSVLKGKLYLKDNNSKFGTLVLMNNPIVVNDVNFKSPWIQCGRTIFRFNIKKPWITFLPCFGSWFGNNKTLKDTRLETLRYGMEEIEIGAEKEEQKIRSTAAEI